VARLAEGCGTLLHLAGRLRAAAAADFDRTNRGGSVNVVGALIWLGVVWHLRTRDLRLVDSAIIGSAAGPGPV
jgi:hypothetical protein